MRYSWNIFAGPHKMQSTINRCAMLDFIQSLSPSKQRTHRKATVISSKPFRWQSSVFTLWIADNTCANHSFVDNMWGIYRDVDEEILNRLFRNGLKTATY